MTDAPCGVTFGLSAALRYASALLMRFSATSCAKRSWRASGRTGICLPLARRLLHWSGRRFLEERGIACLGGGFHCGLWGFTGHACQHDAVPLCWQVRNYTSDQPVIATFARLTTELCGEITSPLAIQAHPRSWHCPSHWVGQLGRYLGPWRKFARASCAPIVTHRDHPMVDSAPPPLKAANKKKSCHFSVQFVHTFVRQMVRIGAYGGLLSQIATRWIDCTSICGSTDL